MPVITVTQINRYIGSILKNDRNIQGIMVRGEISNYVKHFRSGHVYFTLKDSESAIKAVMFASAASRLKFAPEDGMAVIVSGSIGVYERDGAYQLYVNDIIPEGAGAQGAALEQLKRKLQKYGFRFGEFFPAILTDNGGEFSNVFAFENDLDGNRETRLFFCDPNKENTRDVDAIARLCDQHTVPFASNVATAEVLIQGLRRGDLDWRDIVNPKKK